MAKIFIPKSVISIGELSFWQCGGIATINCNILYSGKFKGAFFTEVVLGDNVTIVGEEAFFRCDYLSKVYSKNLTPPTGGENMFSLVNYNPIGCIIHVPSRSVDKYKKAEYWSDYADYIVGYDF